MLRGNAYCLVDEATKAVLRISSEALPKSDGCYVYSVRAEQLPPEVQALSASPIPFDIEAVFIGQGLSVQHDEAACAIVVLESDDGETERRQAELLARRFEAMEPNGLIEAAIVGLVNLQGADAVARAAVGATDKPAAKPKGKKGKGK